jgi:hypothetical protein
MKGESGRKVDVGEWQKTFSVQRRVRHVVWRRLLVQAGMGGQAPVEMEDWRNCMWILLQHW